METVRGAPRGPVGNRRGLDGATSSLPGCGGRASWLLTAVSLHDLQAAPFFLKKSARTGQGSCLAGAASGAAPVRRLARGAGRVSVIDRNPRRGKTIPMEPDRAFRNKARTQGERFFSWLRDEFGGRMIYVRGHRKGRTYLRDGVGTIRIDPFPETDRCDRFSGAQRRRSFPPITAGSGTRRPNTGLISEI